MRIDAKAQIQREVKTLIELQLNRIASQGGLMADIVKLETYLDMVNNTLLTIRALQYIKMQTLKQTPTST